MRHQRGNLAHPPLSTAAGAAGGAGAGAPRGAALAAGVTLAGACRAAESSGKHSSVGGSTVGHRGRRGRWEGGRRGRGGPSGTAAQLPAGGRRPSVARQRQQGAKPGCLGRGLQRQHPTTAGLARGRPGSARSGPRAAAGSTCRPGRWQPGRAHRGRGAGSRAAHAGAGAMAAGQKTLWAVRRRFGPCGARVAAAADALGRAAWPSGRRPRARGGELQLSGGAAAGAGRTHGCGSGTPSARGWGSGCGSARAGWGSCSCPPCAGGQVTVAPSGCEPGLGGDRWEGGSWGKGSGGDGGHAGAPHRMGDSRRSPSSDPMAAGAAGRGGEARWRARGSGRALRGLHARLRVLDDLHTVQAVRWTCRRPQKLACRPMQRSSPSRTGPPVTCARIGGRPSHPPAPIGPLGEAPATPRPLRRLTTPFAPSPPHNEEVGAAPAQAEDAG